MPHVNIFNYLYIYKIGPVVLIAPVTGYSLHFTLETLRLENLSATSRYTYTHSRFTRLILFKYNEYSRCIISICKFGCFPF